DGGLALFLRTSRWDQLASPRRICAKSRTAVAVNVHEVSCTVCSLRSVRRTKAWPPAAHSSYVVSRHSQVCRITRMRGVRGVGSCQVSLTCPTIGGSTCGPWKSWMICTSRAPFDDLDVVLRSDADLGSGGIADGARVRRGGRRERDGKLEPHGPAKPAPLDAPFLGYGLQDVQPPPAGSAGVVAKSRPGPPPLVCHLDPDPSGTQPHADSKRTFAPSAGDRVFDRITGKFGREETQIIQQLSVVSRFR